VSWWWITNLSFTVFETKASNVAELPWRETDTKKKTKRKASNESVTYKV